MLELFLNMFLLVEADAVLPSGPGYLRWVALFGQIGALASLAPCGRSGSGLSIGLMVSPAFKGAVRNYMAVPP
jgi:hypothetical protein